MVAIPALRPSRVFSLDCYTRLFIFTALLFFGGCTLQPVAPLSLDNEVRPVPDTARTFSTDVRPVPGQTRLLRKVEAEAVRQLQAMGYQQTDASADLRVGIRLNRTDTLMLTMEPVEAGRLTLVLFDGDEVLRTGRSPSLNSNDLDFMTDDEISERVRLFLDGIHSVAPASTKTN